MVKWILTAVLCISSASSAGAITSEHTTVCALASDPEKFEGRVVTIDAVVAVGYHFTLLMDDNCPNVGIGLQFSEPAATRRDLIQLREAVEGVWPGRDNDRAAAGTFTGRFFTYFDDVSFRALDVLAVSNLKRLP